MPEPNSSEFFGGDYQIAYADMLATIDSAGQVRFIAEKLALRQGEAVLDTVCGHGRHAIPLATAGYRLTGADRSEVEIGRARQAAVAAGVDARFVVSDMRDLPFAAEFDAAYNVFTSFGYFEDEAEDRRALRAFRHALKPGGRFLIDTINPLALARSFMPRRWERTAAGALVLRESRWDFLEGVLRESLTLSAEGRDRTHELLIRMYTPDALRRALEVEGFRVREAYGSFDGSALGLGSARLILIAEAA